MIRDDEKVYQIDYSQSPEEIKKQEDENEAAKLRHAARREQEWFDKPTLFEKAIDKIAKLKQMLMHRKNIERNMNDKQSTR